MGACQQMMMAQKISAGAPSYLLSDSLDYADSAAAVTAGWANFGTPSWHYQTAPAPLAGYSSSLQMNASSDAVSSPAFTATSDIWVYFQMNQSATAAAGMKIDFRNASDVTVAFCSVLSGGTIRANSGGGTNNDAGTVTANQTYHFWIHYTKGTGANAVCSVYRSLDGTVGSVVATTAGGTSTTDVTHIAMGMGGSTTVVFNKLLVSASSIGDNP